MVETNMNNNDVIDVYLEKNGIAPFQLTIEDIKNVSLEMREECYPVVIEHLLSAGANQNLESVDINDATAVGVWQSAATKVSFSRRYINEFVLNDLTIKIDNEASGNAAANRVSCSRFDNDLELYSIKLTSRNNNEILNQNTSEGLQQVALFTQAYNEQNLNLGANFVGQKIFPLNVNDKMSAAQGPTRPFESVFKLSEYFGGQESWFNQYSYYSDEIIQYEITFTPAWTKKFESVDAIADPLTQTFDAVVINGGSGEINVSISQIVYKIPGEIRSDLEKQTYYMKYDCPEKIQLEDIEQTSRRNVAGNADLAGHSIRFNLSVNKKDFGTHLKALFISNILGTHPLASTDGSFENYLLDQSIKKFVPRNCLFLAEEIEIKVGQQILIDVDTVEKCENYFLSNLGYLNIPQDVSKSCIILREDVLDEFSHKDNVVFSIYIKLDDRLSANNHVPITDAEKDQYLLERDDIYCYVMGEEVEINDKGIIKYLETDLIV